MMGGEGGVAWRGEGGGQGADSGSVLGKLILHHFAQPATSSNRVSVDIQIISTSTFRSSAPASSCSNSANSVDHVYNTSLMTAINGRLSTPELGLSIYETIICFLRGEWKTSMMEEEEDEEDEEEEEAKKKNAKSTLPRETRKVRKVRDV